MPSISIEDITVFLCDYGSTCFTFQGAAYQWTLAQAQLGNKIWEGQNRTCLYSQSRKAQVFQRLSLHHRNSSLANVSVFIVPLFDSVTEKKYLGKKMEGHLPTPLHPPLQYSDYSIDWTSLKDPDRFWGPTLSAAQRMLAIISPGEKRPEREHDSLAPSSTEVHKEWSYNSTSPYAFLNLC